MSERVRQHLAGEPADRVWTNEDGDVIAHEPGRVRVGSEREGWRPRLANVERLLTESVQWYAENFEARGTFPLQQALAEVRSMIDGDETP